METHDQQRRIILRVCSSRVVGWRCSGCLPGATETKTQPARKQVEAEQAQRLTKLCPAVETQAFRKQQDEQSTGEIPEQSQRRTGMC
jgi:hypothetical protein